MPGSVRLAPDNRDFTVRGICNTAGQGRGGLPRPALGVRKGFLCGQPTSPGLSGWSCNLTYAVITFATPTIGTTRCPPDPASTPRPPHPGRDRRGLGFVRRAGDLPSAMAHRLPGGPFLVDKRGGEAGRRASTHRGGATAALVAPLSVLSASTGTTATSTSWSSRSSTRPWRR
jgi:hypothetical protein